MRDLIVRVLYVVVQHVDYPIGYTFQIFLRKTLIILYLRKLYSLFFDGMEVVIEHDNFLCRFTDIKNQGYWKTQCGEIAGKVTKKLVFVSLKRKDLLTAYPVKDKRPRLEVPNQFFK